jgi:hypothetical protein
VRTPTPKKPKVAKFEQPVNPDQAEQVDRGPRYQIRANALFSKTFVGRVDLGIFSKAEEKRGVVTRRVEELKLQGYQQIEVIVLVSAKPEEE